MRDIRGDLLVRAKLLEEQIGATQSQFDKFIEQLKLEHQGKLEDLKSDLDTVHMVIKTEDRFLGSVRPAAELRSESMPRQQPGLQQAQSQHPTSDATRKVSALSVSIFGPRLPSGNPISSSNRVGLTGAPSPRSRTVQSRLREPV